jgi:hypothetical protein
VVVAPADTGPFVTPADVTTEESGGGSGEVGADEALGRSVVLDSGVGAVLPGPSPPPVVTVCVRVVVDPSESPDVDASAEEAGAETASSKLKEALSGHEEVHDINKLTCRSHSRILCKSRFVRAAPSSSPYAAHC